MLNVEIGLPRAFNIHHSTLNIQHLSLCYVTRRPEATMTDAPLKKTPLNAVEHELGGKMVDFGGWELPVQFAGILEEHAAVREHVGLFDVSHMGELTVKGPDALTLLQRATCNDVSKLENGRAQ